MCLTAREWLPACCAVQARLPATLVTCVRHSVLGMPVTRKPDSMHIVIELDDSPICRDAVMCEIASLHTRLQPKELCWD